MPMFNIIGSSSTQSVIDIRELQFEKCLETTQRKEVDHLSILLLFKCTFCLLNRSGE